ASSAYRSACGHERKAPRPAWSASTVPSPTREQLLRREVAGKVTSDSLEFIHSRYRTPGCRPYPAAPPRFREAPVVFPLARLPLLLPPRPAAAWSLWQRNEPATPCG